MTSLKSPDLSYPDRLRIPDGISSMFSPLVNLVQAVRDTHVQVRDAWKDEPQAPNDEKAASLLQALEALLAYLQRIQAQELGRNLTDSSSDSKLLGTSIEQIKRATYFAVWSVRQATRGNISVDLREILFALQDEEVVPVLQALLDVARVASEVPELVLPSVQELQTSFARDYVGKGVDGLFETLTAYDEQFSNHSPQYYGKYISIVQSSGTGKSRTIVELAQKGVLVLYMNLRSTRDTLNWPPRDVTARTLLLPGDQPFFGLSFKTRSGKYGSHYHVVLAAIFRALKKALTDIRDTCPNKPESICRIWNDQMDRKKLDADESNMRPQYWALVDTEVDMIRAELSQRERKPAVTSGILASDNRTANAENDRADDIIDGVNKIALSSAVSEPTASEEEAARTTKDEGDLASTKKAKDRESLAATELLKLAESASRNAYEDLVESFPEIFAPSDPEKVHSPKLVIAIDEAHELIGDGTRVQVDALCRSISHYCDTSKPSSTWVIFASTNSKLVDFSPPAYHHSSRRIAVGEALLFRPYTLTGWDQFAPNLRAGLAHPDKISNANTLLRFGRPLWHSLLKIGGSPPAHLMRLGMEKLLSSPHVDIDFDEDQSFAIWSQRFGLDISLHHADYVNYAERGVATHMRYCLWTDEGRIWQLTFYPSEPFLSHVAAVCLYASRTTNLSTAVTHLKDWVQSGLVNQGASGELVCRLVLLLCKDFWLLKSFKGELSELRTLNSFEQDLRFCQPVPLLDYLELLLGKLIYPGSDVDGQVGGQREQLRNVFKNAQINFSHWISMEEFIHPNNSDITWTWNPKYWLFRHWMRTSAIQCCHQQPDIAQVIPIFWTELPTDLQEGRGQGAEERMSVLMISDKARKEPSPKALAGVRAWADSVQCDTGLPSVAILLDVGVEDKNKLPEKREATNLGKSKLDFFVDATYPEVTLSARHAEQDKPRSPCWRIHAQGVTKATFPFLSRHEQLAEGLRWLVTDAKQPGPDKVGTLGELQAGVRFSASMEPRYSIWDRNLAPPDL